MTLIDLSSRRPSLLPADRRRTGAETGKEISKPGPHCDRHRRQIRLETVIAGHFDDRAPSAGRRNPKRITRPLHDQNRNRNPL